MTPVAAGLSSDEIAIKLVVSPLTAKTHVSRSMIKLGGRGRASSSYWPTSTAWRSPGGR